MLASSERSTQRPLYLDFGIRDGSQKLGVMGDGYRPYAITFWTAVKYGVHWDSEKQDRGVALAEGCLASQ